MNKKEVLLDLLWFYMIQSALLFYIICNYKWNEKMWNEKSIQLNYLLVLHTSYCCLLPHKHFEGVKHCQKVN